MSAPFLTVAGRWKQCSEASGIDKSLTQRDLTLAMMMFYAGFSASLEAGVELAEFPDSDALQMLKALHIEVKQVEAIASRMVAGGQLS